MSTVPPMFRSRMFFVFAVVMWVSVTAGTAGAQDCSAVTDDEIVTAVIDGIKGDSLLAPQISHIVVGSVNRFLKFQGWTDTRRGYERLMSIVSGVNCVTAINVNRFEEVSPPADSPLRPQPGGCAAGMKACGDVCIPEADACSGRSKAGMND